MICYIVLTSDFGNLVNIWTEIFHKIIICVAKPQMVNFLVKSSPKRRETHQGLIFSCREILLQCLVILYTYICANDVGRLGKVFFDKLPLYRAEYVIYELKDLILWLEMSVFF